MRMAQEEVAAVVFGCDQTTEEECLGRNLFGLPVTFRDDIEKTKKGTPVFLFNYYTRQLHGVFEAAADGGFNINAHAFGQMVYKDGTQGSRFPSQLSVVRIKDAGHIPEFRFQAIIKDNYYHKSKFHPFLSKQQTEEILKLFEQQFKKQQEQLNKRKLEDEEKQQTEQQIKKQKVGVVKSSTIDLQQIADGLEDRTNICIKMVPPIVAPIQMIKVLSRCIPGQFDFISLLKLSKKGTDNNVLMGSYNLFVNCTCVEAVQKMHWWMHGNSWTDIWAAASGQLLQDCPVIIQLEFARSQGLKEIVSMFRTSFIVANTDPMGWTDLPGYRIWIQQNTDPALVDEIEYHLNQLRIQSQQNKEQSKQKLEEQLKAQRERRFKAKPRNEQKKQQQQNRSTNNGINAQQSAQRKNVEDEGEEQEEYIQLDAHCGSEDGDLVLSMNNEEEQGGK